MLSIKSNSILHANLDIIMYDNIKYIIDNRSTINIMYNSDDSN